MKPSRPALAESVLGLAFLACSGMVAAVAAGWGDDGVPDLVARSIDAVWITLGFAVAWLAVARTDGARSAGLQLAIIGTTTSAITVASTLTGLPLGEIVYTDAFGWRIFGVMPFTIPLLWFVVVVGARDLWDTLIRWPNAVGMTIWVAILSLAHAFNMAVFAWKIRHYWEWYPHLSDGDRFHYAFPPITNFFCWLIVPAVLAYACSGLHRATAGGRRLPGRAGIAFLVVNAVFVIARAMNPL